jgi:hypothetical protein
MAGEWARVRGMVLSLWPLFLSSAAFGAFLASLFLGSRAWLFGALFVASLISLLVCWKKGLRRVESFFRGARGEERVANILASLPDSYHVFNDFEAGGDRVDHVVAGPAGVFSVETKCWQGRVEIVEGHVLVNGVLPSRDPVSQTQREADKVCAAIRKFGFDVTVVPVVCFASDTFAAGAAQCGPVRIINACGIGEWFASMPEAIPPDGLARLVRLLETGR